MWHAHAQDALSGATSSAYGRVRAPATSGPRSPPTPPLRRWPWPRPGRSQRQTPGGRRRASDVIAACTASAWFRCAAPCPSHTLPSLHVIGGSSSWRASFHAHSMVKPASRAGLRPKDKDRKGSSSPAPQRIHWLVFTEPNPTGSCPSDLIGLCEQTEPHHNARVVFSNKLVKCSKCQSRERERARMIEEGNREPVVQATQSIQRS